MVGAETDGDSKSVVFTHQSFKILYNGDRIIEVTLTTDNRAEVSSGADLTFTFSVEWIATEKSFESRFDYYLDSSFFEHQIHWFSIFNSFMMVVFLCGLVFLIFMRTLRNDISKYQMEEDDLDLERIVDEAGWKQVHGDVFRAPNQLSVLSALVGTGHQMLWLVLLILLGAIFGSLYASRGAMMSSMITIYTLTSFIAGYSSGSLFKKFNGRDWKVAMILTAALFPGVGLFIALTLNWLAIIYSASAAIPFGTIVGMFSLWLLVSSPLNIAGTLFGRRSSAKGDFPLRVTNIPRPIINRKWYTNWAVISLAGGVLPFGSIFVEMYFVFTSFWNYKFYYVYGFMLLVFLIMIIVNVCVTIVLVYFLLNSEDYRWQWTSFLCGASTGFYVFSYSMYYYSTTFMSGIFQASYYFGYSLIFCIFLSILCGSVSFTAAKIFVSRIYQNIKGD
jgi:transmembrane 9 superfamily protein 3